MPPPNPQPLPAARLLAFFLLMVLGWQSFNALPITRFPNIDVPLVAITVNQSGAAPAELETHVAETAAALAIEGKQAVQDVPYETLRELLLKQGQRL